MICIKVVPPSLPTRCIDASINEVRTESPEYFHMEKFLTWIVAYGGLLNWKFVKEALILEL
jgi:hypothetical protein